MIRGKALVVIVVTVISVIAGGPVQSVAQEISPDIYEQLKYRFIGPQGNRVIAVAGVPGDPRIGYAGAASGGIFKTTDALGRCF